MSASELPAKKLISIIIAVYNSGHKIEKTLDSIFSQNQNLFEVFLIDGLSTDNTLDYVQKYGNKLTVISEKDDGVFDAFNKGINFSSGKYLYFIGAGDCLKPNILETIADYLPPKIPTLVYGSCYLMKQKVVWQGTKFRKQNFVTGNICHQAIFYHREIFSIAGKYNPRYKISADWFLNVKCFSSSAIENLYIPFVIADFEEGGLSENLANDREFVKDFPLLIKKHLGLKAYLKRKAFVASPKYYIRGFNLVGKLVMVGRPFFHTYKNLKKNIINKFG